MEFSIKNYLFIVNISPQGFEMLRSDLKNSKVFVGISAGNDSIKNDSYFFEGTEKYTSIVNNFKQISNNLEFKLLDFRIKGTVAQNILKTADVIYLTGGDPLIQLQYMKENGLDRIIKNFRGIIIGLSAGSMNQCRIAYYCKDEDILETMTYEGLGLVDVTITPHYEIENDIQVNEHKKWSQQLPIIGLPNNSFIVVNNGLIEIYGKSHR